MDRDRLRWSIGLHLQLVVDEEFYGRDGGSGVSIEGKWCNLHMGFMLGSVLFNFSRAIFLHDSMATLVRLSNSLRYNWTQQALGSPPPKIIM